jgi:hypothetical protein
MEVNREPLKPLSISITNMAPPSEQNPVTERDASEHLLYTHALKKRKLTHPGTVLDSEVIAAEARSVQVIPQIICR